jgi:hypothetical protein
MKKLTIFLIFLLTLVGCATTKETPPQEFGGKPDVFCNVIQKPDPLLMGTWECRFERIVGKNRRRPDANHVKYRLIKQDDTYGKEILGEPRKFGVKIFVQGKDVYFTIRALDKPAKMSRVEE